MSVSNTPSTPLTPSTPVSPTPSSSLRARACLRKPSLNELKVDTRQQKFSIQQCALHATTADYERLEMLGRSNATVFQVRCRKTGVLRAVKVYCNDGHDPCKQEYELMKSLDHESIPKVYQFYRGVRNSAFAMDFVPGVTLELARHMGPVPMPHFMLVAEQLLTVLAHIHGQGLLHRDVSCDNLLFDSATGKLTLIDWNIAREYAQPEPPSEKEAPQTARTVRAHSPTHKGKKRGGEELAPEDDSCTDLSSPHPSDCGSDFTEYGKPSYREPAGFEGSPMQRDMYAAGVVLRMLRPSDPPEAVARVLAGLVEEPPCRLSAQAGLDKFHARRVVHRENPR